MRAVADALGSAGVFYALPPYAPYPVDSPPPTVP